MVRHFATVTDNKNHEHNTVIGILRGGEEYKKNNNHSSNKFARLLEEQKVSAKKAERLLQEVTIYSVQQVYYKLDNKKQQWS